MKKIKLELDRLHVESFDTAASESDARGTVHGHWSQMGTCDGRVATCQWGGTCGNGCATGIRCTGNYCL